MVRQRDEMKYRSKFEPTFQLDYPVRLVASLAVQILGKNIKVADDEALRDAATRACKLIDACHEEAARHYIEVNGLTPLRLDESPLLYKEAVRKIVGEDRFKDRLAAAIRDFEKYFATLVDRFYDLDDDDRVAADNPRSAAYGRMQISLAAYKERGIIPSKITEFRWGYKDWTKRKISESRATAGAKGGIEKAKKRRAKDAKTGKYKQKEKNFLTPKEQQSLDAKVKSLPGKKAKRLPN